MSQALFRSASGNVSDKLMKYWKGASNVSQNVDTNRPSLANCSSDTASDTMIMPTVTNATATTSATKGLAPTRASAVAFLRFPRSVAVAPVSSSQWILRFSTATSSLPVPATDSSRSVSSSSTLPQRRFNFCVAFVFVCVCERVRVFLSSYSSSSL